MNSRLRPGVGLIVIGLASSPAAPPFPRYDRVLLLEATSETSANVSIGDVNGDGKLDFVLAKGRHWPLVDRVLLGDGKGNIVASYDLGTASDRSYSGRLVDLDGDGDLDVVISNDAPDPKLVYLNDGTGHFHVGSSYGDPKWETRNATVADVNGDGLPDIIAANRGDSTANYICLNRGKGIFDSSCTAFSRESATTITAADFDKDGLIDLAVPHRDGGQSYVYLNGPKGVFADTKRIPFGPGNAAIRMSEAADFDGDGRLDLVTIDERSGVAIYFGLARGGFSQAVTVAGAKPTPYALAVRDLNDDGRPDIIVGHVEAPSTIYGNGDTGRGFTAMDFGDNKGTVYGYAIADVNGDGVLDIAAARSEAPNVLYFGSLKR
jgi:hypothetical protein